MSLDKNTSSKQRSIGVILDDLYYELVSSPAWNAHIEAIFELSGLYQEILQYMRTKGLSTKALENAYLTASMAYEAAEQDTDSRLEDWEKLTEIDQAFMTEMAKTASVIAEIVHIHRRKKEHDLLMDIRNGKYLGENGQMLPEFFEMVRDYENRAEMAYHKSELPPHVDRKKIDEMMIRIYEEYVLSE